MFNFFDEIKKASNFKIEDLQDYQIITISGKLLYVEGHRGLLLLSKEQISFAVKSGKIIVQGQDLILSQLTDKTLTIAGKIIKIEAQS